jgi:hypothetical protein
MVLFFFFFFPEQVLLHQTIDGCKRESSRVERLLRSNIGNADAKEDLRRAYEQLQNVLQVNKSTYQPLLS